MSYQIVTLLVVWGASVVCLLRVIVQANPPKILFFLFVSVLCIGGLDVEGFPLARVFPEGFRLVAADMYVFVTSAVGTAEHMLVTAIADNPQG